MAEQHATAYDSKIEGNVIFTRLDAAFNWVRKNSLWPMPMGLACCAIELMATAASRFDNARFGAETDLRTNAGTEMGHCDGRVRIHRRHVSLLCRLAGNRSAYSGRCLHFRLSAASGSAPGRFDKIAGKN